MKVLHVLNSDYGSRATMGVRSFHIASRMENVSVFCRGNLSLQRSKIFFPFVGFRLFSRGIQFLRRKHIAFAKLKIIEKHIFEFFCKSHIKDADVIHFFYHSKKLIKYAKSLKKKIIVEGFTNPLHIKAIETSGVLMDTTNYIVDQDEVFCYQNSDILLSPSKWVTHSFQKDILPNAIREVLYGVDEFQKAELSFAGKIKFCFAGGIKRTKGVIDLLKAFEIVNEKFKNKTELHLYGRVYSEVKDEIAKYLCDNIFVHGYEDSVNAIYLDKHVYVLPSYFEGSSKTILEAMAFGLPVITTFNSGSPVEEPDNGFVVEVNDHERLAARMMQLIESEALIRKVGDNNYKKAKGLTWGRYAKEVHSIYDELDV